MTPIPSRTVAALTGVVAAATVSAGLWAMALPHSFYTVVAPFQPYNEHLVHDIGAFQLGLGTCLALGLVTGDGLLAVLSGNAVGADAHAVSHLMDRHLGGHTGDPLTIGALGVLVTLLALTRWHLGSHSPATAEIARQAKAR